MKAYFLLLLLCSVQLLPAQEPAPKPLIFITDASGSMWQKVENEYKIVLAREVLGDLVEDLDASQPIGLVAYGHRQKSDCSDIEELLPISNTDKVAFQQALNGLNPTGMTPLAQTAKQVINQLKEAQQAATVILVTDGLETCEGDLCAIVQEAKAAGIEFVMHIVGFDLGESDKASLECAARESGGTYIDAQNKAELVEALEETRDWTVDVATGNLSVKCLRNGELIDCSIYAYPTGSNKDIANVRTYASPESNPALMPIPTGSYDLTATVVNKQGIPPLTYQAVQVQEGQEQSLVFDFSSGMLELTVTSMEELHDAVVSIRPKGDNQESAKGRTYAHANSNPIKKELAPGQYDVQIRSVSINGQSSEVLLENITISAGKTATLKHDFAYATLSVGATKEGQLQDATVRILEVATQKGVAQGRTYSSAKSNPKTFLLSPGRYKITVKALKITGEAVQTFILDLEPGKSYSQIATY